MIRKSQHSLHCLQIEFASMQALEFISVICYNLQMAHTILSYQTFGIYLFMVRLMMLSVAPVM
jgi:ABC-type transport system involved in cytochrome bd biosynthesis fused ATPase/permease subunit